MHVLKFFILIAFLALSPSDAFCAEVETTIVVINGKALLVDLDDSGNVIKTYMEVENYFNSDSDHDTKVANAKSEYVMLTQRQLDQIRFIAITDDTEQGISDAMASNLTDLSMHYQETYANEILITAARNEKTSSELDTNIKMIKEYLVQYGVNEEDINVQFKIDMGDEPTQFIKVISHLQNLPAQ